MAITNGKSSSPRINQPKRLGVKSKRDKVIKELSNLLLTILGAGLIAMLTIVWNSKVGRAEFDKVKAQYQTDIAVIKNDISHIKNNTSEIKEAILRIEK
jgi:hypothetical protein